MDDTAGRMRRHDITGSPADAVTVRTGEEMRGAAAAADAHGVDESTERRAREIRHDIAATRAEMSETIEAIEDKLRPRNIVAGAAERVKTAATDTVRATTDKVREMTGRRNAPGSMRMQGREEAGGFVDRVRDNPIPALLIGVGAAWLLMTDSNWRGRRGREYPRDDTSYPRYGRGAGYSGIQSSDDAYAWESAENAGGPFEDRPGESDLGAGTREYVEGAGERAREVAEMARYRARQAQSQLQRMTRENPLAVGAGALILGAAVGLAIPETERENEWLGETRDNMVNRATDMAKDAASRVQDAAADIVTGAKQT